MRVRDRVYAHSELGRAGVREEEEIEIGGRIHVETTGEVEAEGLSRALYAVNGLRKKTLGVLHSTCAKISGAGCETPTR